MCRTEAMSNLTFTPMRWKGLKVISNVRSYASTYHCVKCERDFRDSLHLNRHEKICKSVQIPEEKFVGGYKHLKMTVF